MLATPATRHAYAYGLNNPLLYRDPTGRYIFETEPTDLWHVATPRVRSQYWYTQPEYHERTPTDRELAETATIVFGAPIIALAAETLLLDVALPVAETACSAAGRIAAQATRLSISRLQAAYYAVYRWWTLRQLPLQEHHYATNKGKVYPPRFEQILRQYGLRLQDSWNKTRLPHSGRHPYEYHEFVLDGMRRAASEAGADVARFLELFKTYVIEPVNRNPMPLRKAGWQ